MNEADFDRRYREIERDVSRAPTDQALAALFTESEWTQKKIADHLGMSYTWVCRQLTFGRFLDFATGKLPVGNKLGDLTEWAFRELWEKTNNVYADERLRFQQVERALGFEPTPIPAPEPVARVARYTKPSVDDVLARLGVKNNQQRRSDVANVLAGHPNIVDKVLNKEVGLQAASCFCRVTPLADQATATAKQVARVGNNTQAKGRIAKREGKPPKQRQPSRIDRAPLVFNSPKLGDEPRPIDYRKPIPLQAARLEALKKDERETAAFVYGLSQLSEKLPGDMVAFRAAIDRMLAHKVVKDGIDGEDHDYPQSARKYMDKLDRTVGKLIEKLKDLATQLEKVDA